MQLKELESLAGQGFLAVGVDNVGHGERRYPDFDRRLSQDNPDYNENFLRAVLETARETPRLLDALLEKGLAREDRIGALGISMGAFIAYTAVTLEPRLRVVVALVGSPEWPLDLPASPHRQLKRFDRVRLLSQTAGQDAVVPSRYARAFHGRLTEMYGDYDARFATPSIPSPITFWRRTGIASGNGRSSVFASTWFDMPGPLVPSSMIQRGRGLLQVPQRRAYA